MKGTLRTLGLIALVILPLSVNVWSGFSHPVQASSQPAWQHVGPNGTIQNQTTDKPNWSGRVQAMVPDPTNSSVLYAGTENGGVEKTADGGQTWTSLTDSASASAMGQQTSAMAITPDGSTVYAFTGHGGWWDFTGAGLWSSTTGGTSWARDDQYGTTFTHSYSDQSLVIDPNLSSRLYVGVLPQPTYVQPLPANYNEGFFYSPDYGATWTQMLTDPLTTCPTGSKEAANQIAALSSGGKTTLYAGVACDESGFPGQGLWTSPDQGKTWQALGGSTFADKNVMTIGVSSQNLVVETSAPGIALSGVWVSSDGGSTWQNTAPNPAVDFDPFNVNNGSNSSGLGSSHSIVVDPGSGTPY